MSQAVLIELGSIVLILGAALLRYEYDQVLERE